MTTDFSLPKDPFSPIRPAMVEQLFSPSTNKRRVINDMTYRVPVEPVQKPSTLVDVDTSNWCLPSFTTSKFPRQSTGIKKPPNFGESKENEAENVTVAETTKFEDIEFHEPLSDAIPEYRPFYQVKDVQPIRATCFHPFGDVFIVGTNSKKLFIYPYPCNNELDNFSALDDPSEPQFLFQFQHFHRGSIYCSVFNENGNLLASGSNDQTVHIVRYDPEKQQPTGEENILTINSGTVRDVRFLGSQLLSAGAGNDFGINMTDSETLRRTQMLAGHSGTVMSMHTWDDPNLFASASLDSTIRLWDIRAGRSIHSTATNKPGGDEKDQSATPAGVVRVEHSGKLLVSGHEDGRCMLYDIRGSRILQIYQAHDKEIRAMDFSPKTYYLLTGAYDGKIKLADLQGDLSKKLPTVELAQQPDKVIQTAWHPTEYNFTSTCADGSATLWTLPKTC